jgi:diadenylate cyclase
METSFASGRAITWRTLVDILAVAFLIYQFVAAIRGRRAAQALSGLVVLAGTYGIAVWARLDLLRSLLQTLAPYTAFALIVMFQSEIRRVLARIGRQRWLGLSGRMQRRESIEEVILALEHLARTKTGALIVLERDVGLRSFVETGVVMDAALSRDLLLSVFYPGTPLHDGAVIVQGDRVAAAACFLPLTTNPNVASKLGTRHRAGIGITEEADCLALVVSEETGWISIAAYGEIEMDLTLRQVEGRLLEHFTKGGPPDQERGEALRERGGDPVREEFRA